MLFSGSFKVSGFILSPSIQFELIFVYNTRYRLKNFFEYGWPIVLALFAEKTKLSSLNCLCLFLKRQLAMFMRVYFWVLLCSIDLCVCPFSSISVGGPKLGVDIE